jgi:large subunit ribosomal protein L2
MALKTFKPTTPSQRQLVLVDRSHLWKGKPVKALTEGLTKSGGRNNQGRVSMWHRGGGHKRSYRMVDFKRGKLGMPATVERLEFDPNRTAFIALIRYEDGELAYILAPQRLAAGDTVIADARVDVKPGNAMPLANMPIGTIVHNVEMKVGKGGQIARAAGPMCSSSAAMRATPSSGSILARRAWCRPPAWRPLAPCQTRTTPTSRSARPAACAGRGASRSCAAWP